MFRLRNICDVTKELRLFSTKTKLAEPTKEAIKIPKRIKRSSTCVLNALARTVGRDFTAPDYKYVDDPFLAPGAFLDKLNYGLAMESGRRAARWIKQQHPYLFQVNALF